jgi:hypothetical protein
MSHRTSSSLLGVALLASSLVAMSCGCSRAAYAPNAATESATAGRPAQVASDGVEVLLDRAPTRPFTVTGELSARRIESPASIAAMQQRAAQEGLDGIYWIDCSRGAKVCTAKGFVYDKVSPAMPEINARTVAAEADAKHSEVAHR